MAEPLSPIHEATDEPPLEPEHQAALPPSSGLSRWLVIAVVLLGVFTGWLAWQTAQLQSQNSALQGQVTSLQAQLQAYQTHLTGARERTRDLRTQVDELEAFLAQSPVE